MKNVQEGQTDNYVRKVGVWRPKVPLYARNVPLYARNVSLYGRNYLHWKKCHAG